MEWFEESRYNDPKRGGYGEIEIGNVQRADIDDIAEEYNVEVVYREGKAEVYGSTSSEIKEFMKDVESSEKTMTGSEHPSEFGFSVEDPFSVLENESVDRGERTVTDGGFSSPTDRDPRYEADGEPYTGEFGNILTGGDFEEN